MTANQINYAKYLEDVRSHKASEDINRRQAEAAEAQAEVAAANAVTNRMNAETNKQNSLINESAVGAQWYGAQANAAYQQAMAAVSQAQQTEAARHNRTAESQNLIVEGWKNTTNQYRIQKDTEVAYAQQANQRLINEQTIRGNLVNTLISGGVKLASELAPKLINGVSSILSGG